MEYIPNSAEPQCSPKDILPSQYLPKSSHKHLMFPTHASKLFVTTCLKILKRSPVYKSCRDILETEKVQDMLRGCSKDIEVLQLCIGFVVVFKLFQSLNWVYVPDNRNINVNLFLQRAGHPYIGRLIMNIFEESCLIELSLGRWDNLALLDMIRNSTCINRCTERGHCKSGVCECEEGGWIRKIMVITIA